VSFDQASPLGELLVRWSAGARHTLHTDSDFDDEGDGRHSSHGRHPGPSQYPEMQPAEAAPVMVEMTRPRTKLAQTPAPSTPHWRQC
jgi:hypothetical protein